MCPLVKDSRTSSNLAHFVLWSFEVFHSESLPRGILCIFTSGRRRTQIHSVLSKPPLVTCLTTVARLTADPGVTSLIPAQSHTFVEMNHEIISMVILLPFAVSF